AFNAEKTIGRSINSVLEQTYQNIELIIIDDGSTDNTLKIIQHYQNEDSRIVYKSTKNSGVSVARNTGIEMASGDYFMFLGSDDFFSHQTVSKLLKAIKEHAA